MLVKYTGPMDAVNVGGYGKHKRGEVKDYAPEFAKQLLASSIKQRFELVVDKTDPKAKETKDDKKK